MRLRAYLLSLGDGAYTARTPEEDEAWRRSYRTWLGPVTAGDLPTVRVGVIDGAEGLSACAIAVVDHRAPTAYCPSGLAGWVQTVVVDPSVRGRGLGKSIMRDALTWLGESGAETVVLQTTGAGDPLYRALGFNSTGEDLLYLNMRGC
ncbi:GNAT family N-acetyltransferase [Nocardiopsis sp. NPDC101807]|uniref:GNAT family N-acetyltransferase n=1 Tax=Nocardiopsis sp. NPDC101807 TaxID=3364339 RepID=UPI003820532B